MVMSRVRVGLTLIEVVVVIAILSLLCVLLIPAVQSARDAARRATCTRNLQQIGIAFSSYVSTHGIFPQSYTGSGYSPQVIILPYLDQFALYAAINFSILSNTSFAPENSTAGSVTMDAYLCPADGGRADVSHTNYAGNRGYGFDEAGHANNGMFVHPRYGVVVGYHSITDGSSQTALFSEWLVGPDSMRRNDARRSTYVTPVALRKASELEVFIGRCSGLDPETATTSGFGKGLAPFHGDLMSTLYNHNIPPNGRSCVNGGLVQQGSWTAGSNHAGVNLLMADGHVSPSTRGVALAIWRALGSRAGGEIFTSF